MVRAALARRTGAQNARSGDGGGRAVGICTPSAQVAAGGAPIRDGVDANREVCEFQA